MASSKQEKFNQHRYAKDRRSRVLRFLANDREPCCIQCGYKDERALVFDHIHNDGHRDRKTGWSLLNQILDEPERFQILCHNCNYLKELENRSRQSV